MKWNKRKSKTWSDTVCNFCAVNLGLVGQSSGERAGCVQQCGRFLCWFPTSKHGGLPLHSQQSHTGPEHTHSHWSKCVDYWQWIWFFLWRIKSTNNLLTRQQTDVRGLFQEISLRRSPASTSHKHNLPSFEQLICNREGPLKYDHMTQVFDSAAKKSCETNASKILIEDEIRIYHTVWGPNTAGDPVSVTVRERLGQNSRRHTHVPQHQSLKWVKTGLAASGWKQRVWHISER